MAAIASGLSGDIVATRSQSSRAPSISPRSARILPRSSRAGTEFGRELQRLGDVVKRRVEPVQRAVGGGAVDQRLDTGRIGFQHTVEIGNRLVVPPGRPRRLGPVEQQLRIVGPQLQRQTGGFIGARRIAGQHPGLPA